MAGNIDKKGMVQALDGLCRWGGMKKLESKLDTYYNSMETGYLVSVVDDQFILSTEDSIVHYFYDNLYQVALYSTWGMKEVTLQVTPRKELTGGLLFSDSYHLATLGKGNKQYDGFVLNNKE